MKRIFNYPCQVKEDENGKGCFVVIGISGGKDSSVAAALCAEAFGKDQVVGVLMPKKFKEEWE